MRRLLYWWFFYRHYTISDQIAALARVRVGLKPPRQVYNADGSRA